jgi:hypothetical protein
VFKIFFPSSSWSFELAKTTAFLSDILLTTNSKAKTGYCTGLHNKRHTLGRM